MKIETFLSPNCSESTFVVVDWKKKHILETYEMSSDGGQDNEGWFVVAIDDAARKKYSIEETKNSGDSYHTTMVEAIKRNVSEGHSLKLDQDEIDEVLTNDDGSGTEIIIDKCYMSKVEKMAAGLYGGKNAAKSS